MSTKSNSRTSALSLALVTSCAAIVSSCCAATIRGRAAPALDQTTSASQAAVIASSPMIRWRPDLSRDRPPREAAAAVLYAKEALQHMLADPRFARWMERRPLWLGACDATCVPYSGTEMLVRMREYLETSTRPVVLTETSGGNVTEATLPGITIRLSTQRWSDGMAETNGRPDVVRRAQFLNSLTHELVHSLPDPTGQTFPFTDTYHGMGEFEDRLYFATYQFGDMAEVYWIIANSEQRSDEAAIDAMEQLLERRMNNLNLEQTRTQLMARCVSGASCQDRFRRLGPACFNAAMQEAQRLARVSAPRDH